MPPGPHRIDVPDQNTLIQSTPSVTNEPKAHRSALSTTNILLTLYANTMITYLPVPQYYLYKTVTLIFALTISSSSIVGLKKIKSNQIWNKHTKIVFDVTFQ